MRKVEKNICFFILAIYIFLITSFQIFIVLDFKIEIEKIKKENVILNKKIIIMIDALGIE